MTNSITRSPLSPSPLSRETLTRLLDRMAALPALAGRYVGLSGHPLEDFPILTKADLRTAQRDVLALAVRRPTGALVLGSGGTTGAPKLSLMPDAMFVAELRRHWNPLDHQDILIN